MTTWREVLAFVFDRQQSYKLTFQINQPANVAVLKDLATFCRAHESTFHPDARIAGNLDGRREVWLRIQQHLGMTTEQLSELYHGNPAARKD
jgi:hypothetical protein